MRLYDRNKSRSITVAHLHGVRDEAGKHDTLERRAQAHALVDLVERVRQSGDITVVGGDFNLLPDSESFDILAGIGLVDLVGTGDTRTSRYTKPVRHASYMLVSHPDEVKKFEIVVDPEVSDHRPLLLEL